MTEDQKKVALAALIVLILAIGGWRTFSAVRDSRSGADHAMTPADWVAMMKVEVVGRVPDGVTYFQQNQWPREPALPHLTLAHFRQPLWVHQAKEFQDSKNQTPAPVFNAIGQMRGNASTIDGVEESDRGEGFADLLVTAYLVYIERPADPIAKRIGTRACVVRDVFPGSAAEKCGLRAGDVLVDVDHAGLDVQARATEDPCTLYMHTTLHVRPEVPEIVTVARGSELVDVTMVKSGEKFGYTAFPCPVLTPDQMSQLKPKGR